MPELREIALTCNGPSAVTATPKGATVFRVNHWYLQGGKCDDWFIGEHSEIVHAAAAFIAGQKQRGLRDKPVIWMPGLSGEAIERNQKLFVGCTIRIQKHFQHLPALCRWDTDPRPRRPLMGSWALAVAVGMQPEVLYLSGMDLYQHEKGDYTSIKPPDNRDGAKEAYLSNTHGNHSLLGDLKYIRSALDAYSGKLVCVGSVMKRYFADDYKKWEWIDG
jgi:hypothetical protein